MATLLEVWSLLQRVRSLRFEARSQAGTGWDGIGYGSVVVSEPAPGVIVFEEAGAWQPGAPGRAPIGFNNVFRWTMNEEALRLEHLRLGRDNPVHLFDMASHESGEWREVSPHQCREDCYTASLAVLGAQIQVVWSIQGPRKRESIRYTYGGSTRRCEP